MLKRGLRFLVGALFLISGFVKGIDIRGFSFKLEEYFSAQVFNLPFLETWVIPLAIIVVELEILFGLLLMLNIAVRKTLYSLIALCVFFAFLTFYSAYYNVVTDCGCFGDAFKFTPWQSFGKDVILLVLLLFLLVLYKDAKPPKMSRQRYSFLAVGILFSVWVMAHGIRHEPIIDFRDYKVGTDIQQEKHKIAENPSEYKTFYTLENSQTHQVLKVSQDDYINKNYWKDSQWRILESLTTTELVKQGYTSEIIKFKIENAEGADLTEKLLSLPKVVLVCSYAPHDLEPHLREAIEKKVSKLRNTTVYGVSTVSDTFKTIPNALMDGTAIKTIARSNPFIITLEYGKVVEKQAVKDYLE